MVHVPLSPSFICCVSHCHQVYMLYVPLPPSLCAVCPSSTEFYMVYVPVSTLCCYVPLPPSFIWCMSHFHRVLVAPLYVVMSHFHQFVYAVCHTSTESYVLRYVLPVARWFGVISCQCSRKARLFQCTVRVLLHSLPCFVSISLWRCLLPAFSASPGLCCRSFPCLTDHWTELENENVRESVSKKAI